MQFQTNPFLRITAILASAFWHFDPFLLMFSMHTAVATNLGAIYTCRGKKALEPLKAIICNGPPVVFTTGSLKPSTLPCREIASPGVGFEVLNQVVMASLIILCLKSNIARGCNERAEFSPSFFVLTTHPGTQP